MSQASMWLILDFSIIPRSLVNYSAPDVKSCLVFMGKSKRRCEILRESKPPRNSSQHSERREMKDKQESHHAGCGHSAPEQEAKQSSDNPSAIPTSLPPPTPTPYPSWTRKPYAWAAARDLMDVYEPCRAGEHMACPGYTGPLSSSNPSSPSSGELVMIQEGLQTLNSLPLKVKALRNG